MAREFDSADRAHARWETRCNFFRTLARVDETALPSFESLSAKANEMTLAEFKASLAGWSKARNIQTPWVMATLQRTLISWERGYLLGEFANPSNHSTPSNPLLWRTLFFEDIAEAFEGFLGFEPTAETAGFFSKRLDERYEAFKARYIAKQRSEAEAQGYLPYIPRRQREAHLEWLIQYQVLGKNDYNDIAGDYGKSAGKDRHDDTVRSAITDIAKFIGLILRE